MAQTLGEGAVVPDVADRTKTPTIKTETRTRTKTDKIHNKTILITLAPTQDPTRKVLGTLMGPQIHPAPVTGHKVEELRTVVTHSTVLGSKSLRQDKLKIENLASLGFLVKIQNYFSTRSIPGSPDRYKILYKLTQ